MFVQAITVAYIWDGGETMKIKFKHIVMIFLLLVFAAFLLSSKFFEIKNIHVYGIKNVSKEDVIRHSTLQYGANIFRINKKQAMLGIFASPYVKMIKIKRTLPNTVVIDIIEREVIAIIPYVGSFINIDGEGMVLKISGNESKEKLPIINGFKFDTFKIGERLNTDDDERFEVTVKLVQEIRTAGLVNIISEINVSDLDRIKLVTHNGIKVNFGNYKNLQYKISFAKAIIEDITSQKRKGTIEMSHEGNPIFKPE